jgi:O-antigen/teichoic acid export membrane protein
MKPMLAAEGWRGARIWAPRVLEFGAIQAFVQLLNAVSGLIVIRVLSKSDYAYFAIANSMQTACTLLADLGIGIALQVIGGRVWNDRERFGSLLNTALDMRRRYAIASFSLCIPITAWLLWANDAPGWIVVALSAAVAAAGWPLLSALVFGTAVRLHGGFRRIQKLDLGTATLRLSLVCAFALLWMNAVVAAFISAVANWVQRALLRRWAREAASETAPANADVRREMVRLSLVSLPNTIFFCVQGQVTIAILTILGTSTNIADITALGRLAALFAVFTATFTNVLMPGFIRCQDPERLPFLYTVLVGGSVALFAPLAAAAHLFPQPFLWLLGEKYASLQTELGWVVTTGCIGQVLGLMFALNASKGWIRFQSKGFIPVILVCQVAAAHFLDLRQFFDVILFGLVTALAPLPLYVADAVAGLRGSRKAAHAG